jgi:HTH-type transcriptional regulator, transcriptional repressor of NAD biosynthesis genes
MPRGLVLGKFAPYHLGHQHLVTTAAEHVDELVVAVYETSSYEIPAGTRSDWIRELHPDVTVVVLPDLDPDSYDDTTKTAAHADQLRSALGAFTDVFTSEDYGDDLAEALGGRHTAVDPERHRFPISGTQARSDPYSHRRFLHPVVYGSLVHRVVFLGAESTGKTTLARELARRHKTVWVPEYGRELWESRNGELVFGDLEEIARRQLEREQHLVLDANRVLFCDTNAVTTEQWSRRLFGDASARLVRLAAETGSNYTSFLCETDFTWEQDGTRESAGAQAAFQEAIRADLHRRGIPFFSLTGGLERRIKAVERILGLEGGEASVPP